MRVAGIYKTTCVTDKTLIAHVARLWVMKPSIQRPCHLCHLIVRDILKHLECDCNYTRPIVNWFLAYIHSNIGIDTFVEFAFCSKEALVTKMLTISLESEVSAEQHAFIANSCFVDKRIKFYSQNTNLLPSKPKSSFRHLKQGIQEFHRKYVLVPADKAANNVVVVCRLHYVNTLKQELDGTRAYLETDTDEVSVVNAHLNDLPVKFSVYVNEGQDKLPTMYWLPKLHKRPYKARFIANSSSCTTTELSKLLTSCLTAIKSHVIRYCETVYETSNKNWFWSIKNSGEVLSKLKCRGFRATSLSTYDFSTLYTTLPHNLIKEKLLDLIEWTFKRALKNYGSLYLACNDRKAFFTSSDQSRYTLWSCQNVCDALSYLLDNIYIRFGTKLYRQIVGIPMGTNCAPLVADLFLYCYERDFMDSLNHDNQADVIEAFNSTSRYLDDLLNIDNPYFEGNVNQIYPPELQLNKANITDTEAPFLDLHLSVANGFVSSKIYDKRDDFDFDIVNFPFLDGDVPRRASYGVYISQLIRFARVCNHVTDFNARNKCLTAKLLQQGYRYHKLLDMIEWTFKRALKNYGSLYLACNDRKAFFTSSDFMIPTICCEPLQKLRVRLGTCKTGLSPPVIL